MKMLGGCRVSEILTGVIAWLVKYEALAPWLEGMAPAFLRFRTLRCSAQEFLGYTFKDVRLNLGRF
jgi:hypothetical protein